MSIGVGEAFEADSKKQASTDTILIKIKRKTLI